MIALTRSADFPPARRHRRGIRHRALCGSGIEDRSAHRRMGGLTGPAQTADAFPHPAAYVSSQRFPMLESICELNAWLEGVLVWTGDSAVYPSRSTAATVAAAMVSAVRERGEAPW